MARAVALIIDGTDGMLARYLRVSETIPSFDGARLDDIVDYLTYAFAPMVLLWATGRLPDGSFGTLVAVLPLIASSLPVLPHGRQDRRPLLPRLPELLERRGVLRLRARPRVETTTALDPARLLRPGLRAHPLRLPVADQGLRSLNIALTTFWLVTYAVLLAQMPDTEAVVMALSLRLPRRTTWACRSTSPRCCRGCRRSDCPKDAIAADLDD